MSQTTCPTCHHRFFRLENPPCPKCRARTPGLSSLLVSQLNEKPQCSGCGVYGDLPTLSNGPLCNLCVAFYKAGGSAPLELLQDPRASQQLLAASADGSAATNPQSQQLLERALSYQQSASGTRLGQKPRVTGTGPNPVLFSNLAKAHQYNAAKKASLEREKNKKVAIRISSTLYLSNHKGLRPVPGTREGHTFIQPAATKVVEGYACLLGRTHNRLLKLSPDTERNEPSWEEVTVHLQEGTNKAVSIDHFDKNDSILALFNYLVQENFLKPSQVADRHIEIWFAFDEKSDYISGVSEGLQSAIPLRQSTAKSAVPPAQSKASARVLHSRPSAQQVFSRDPPLVEVTFLRVTASTENGADISWSQASTLEKTETILVSKNLEANSTNPGFIGKGTSKYAYYGRMATSTGWKEYAVAVLQDQQLSPHNARLLLRAEYVLMCKGQYFKQAFDQLAQDLNVKIPNFCFDFKEAIFGSLIPKPDTQAHLPHHWFLATPLLRCGPFDPPFRKFTGNDEMGPPEDAITAAVHAFAHFSYVYSGGDLVFCDLQGGRDSSGRVCLVDPQCHTLSKAKDSPVYWDGGPSKIKIVIDKHLQDCSQNQYCNALGLKFLQYTADDPFEEPGHQGQDDPASPSRPKKKRRTASPRGVMAINSLLTS
ncbi:atypical/Alpha protein kinase [Coprinopsis cinerea okayama7|uniref:Atypical/Alpha protein kinase n=1 Tax=Coprinopsis cinerea (strain Okayama-7 / 130 / ATCC MYA-4618 / FGSC 9003) TaxID=240176 RepID=D6RLS8_COPC7|nr:atypical/Alpha protein kinase [Coprinopsis cinerea okayama7\|eukprot:XP_002911771.1 atypical/Alpha protein kinase [Coprinopsis cinerea okayama7\